MFKVLLEVLDLPRLPNAMGWGNLNRYFEQKKWVRKIAQAGIGKAPQEPLKKARVTVTRFSSKAPDTDNLFASLKPVVDALKTNKFIEDDSPEHVALKAAWEKAKRYEKRITILIEEDV